MKPGATALAFVGILSLSACGPPAQEKVADLYLEVARDEGYDPDPECVRTTMGAMPDSDADAIVEAGLDGGAELSDSALDVLNAVVNQCIDVDEYVAHIVADYGAADGVDPDCLSNILGALSSVAQVDDALADAVTVCGAGQASA